MLYILWLEAEKREESHDTKIVFIAIGMQKSLTRSVRPTQHEQTIVHKCTYMYTYTIDIHVRV